MEEIVEVAAKRMTRGIERRHVGDHRIVSTQPSGATSARE